MAGRVGKVRRGDLVALRTERSHVGVRPGDSCRRVVYLLGEVTSVSRGGQIRALRDLDGAEERARGGAFSAYYNVAADDLCAPIAEVLAAIRGLLGADRYARPDVSDEDQLRALLRPFLRGAGLIARWPNGLGWDVDGHHVVRQPDGSLTVALVGLPDGVDAPVSRVAPEGVPAEPTIPQLRALVRQNYLAASLRNAKSEDMPTLTLGSCLR
jgi:hypothetical protein